MRLVINGEERDFASLEAGALPPASTTPGSTAPAAATLASLIEELGMKADRVAVELNREIVPRSHWGATALHQGDRLEIVHFVGGGCSRI